jgi:hypothetical protein
MYLAGSSVKDAGLAGAAWTAPATSSPSTMSMLDTDGEAHCTSVPRQLTKLLPNCFDY